MAIDYPSRYIHSTPPSDSKLLPAYLDGELRRISIAIENIAAGQLVVTHVEPTKRFDGMFRYADGTDWDPGSGAGMYERRGGSWVKL